MQAFQPEVPEQSWHKTGLAPLQIDPPSIYAHQLNLRNLMTFNLRRIHAVHKLVYNSFNENDEPNIGRRCEIAP